MTADLILLAAVIIIIALMAVGVPVFVALGIGTIVFLQTGVAPLGIFGQSLFSGLNSFPFVAIPLFILTGNVVVETGMSNKLLDLARETFGFMKTGVGTAVTGGCGLFATISGSNAADTAALGRIALGPLSRVGYSRSYSSALIASGGATGILIPPSISYIIIGIALGISVSDLFRAAFVPGLLILGSVMVTNIVMSRYHGYEQGDRSEFTPKRIPRAFWEAKFGLLAPFIILGGIYLGIFTPTESAVVAVLATLLVGFVQGSITLNNILPMIEESALVNAMVAPIIAVALVLGQVLTILGIPQAIAASITGAVTGYVPVLLVLLVLFMIAGAVMELGPNILILGPLFLPLAERIGMTPVHYSVFMLSVFAIGFITPPIGLNLYVISGVSDENIFSIARDAIPFVLAMIATVLFIGLFPSLVIQGV